MTDYDISERLDPMLKKLLDENREPTREELKHFIDKYRSILVTDHVKLFGFMLLLIRKKLGLSQTEMGLLTSNFGTVNIRHRGGLSKSGYSKIENGLNHLDFEIIFILSSQLDVGVDTLFKIYYKIIETSHNNNSIFLKKCGNLFYGKQDRHFVSMVDTGDEYFYTSLKDYWDFFNENDKEEILNLIDDAIKVNKSDLKIKFNYLKQMRARLLKRNNDLKNR